MAFEEEQMTPNIIVFGVGGAGGNAVSNMIMSNLEGVQFVVANTDVQALENNPCANRLQLGVKLTKGLGAGARPEIGEASATEQSDEIAQYLEGCNMVFVTAGMGGGTGTGAAPVIAKLAKERNILTVGVVTKPFNFEGKHRMRLAEAGIAELERYVDTLIIIPNQNLFRLADRNTTFADAFRMADSVLHSGVRGVTDLMVMPGLINLDFADVRSVMTEMGKAMMGTGEASGENRAVAAAEAAIANPLLDDVSMKGARGVLINITGGPDMTLFEVDEAANRIREEVDEDANIIFGSTFDENLQGSIRVSVVATGINEYDRSQPGGRAAPTRGASAPEVPQVARALRSENRPSFSPIPSLRPAHAIPKAPSRPAFRRDDRMAEVQDQHREDDLEESAAFESANEDHDQRELPSRQPQAPNGVDHRETGLVNRIARRLRGEPLGGVVREIHEPPFSEDGYSVRRIDGPASQPMDIPAFLRRPTD
jgi:cell division protein FtsZ